MTLTFERDPDNVRMNQRAKYLGTHGSFNSISLKRYCPDIQTGSIAVGYLNLFVGN